MQTPSKWIKVFLVLAGAAILGTYGSVMARNLGVTPWQAGCGLGLGLVVILAASEWLLSRLQVKGLGLLLIGLILGTVVAQPLLLLGNTVIVLLELSLPPPILAASRLGLLFVGLYWGVSAVQWAARCWVVELPFVRLRPLVQRSREILLDPSALTDPRLLDLATTGLFDRRLVLAECVLIHLRASVDSLDESIRNRARRGLETATKLRELPHLGLRLDATRGDAGEPRRQLVQLARELDADVLTGELSSLETTVEGLRFINLNALSIALKPLTAAGEFLELRILRPGKESSQGVGYLQDGTMVVVNGGGEFVGEEVRARVLSVKHSTAGRIVFCNLIEEQFDLSDQRSRPRNHRHEISYRN